MGIRIAGQNGKNAEQDLHPVRPTQVNEFDDRSNRILIGSDLSTKPYENLNHGSTNGFVGEKTSLTVFVRTTLWSHQ